MAQVPTEPTVTGIGERLLGNLTYRFTEGDFETVGSSLLDLPPGDPLASLWGCHRHYWLRDNPADEQRIETANRSYLEAIGMMEDDPIELDW